ncbi:MAG: hypothetical protein K2K52_00110, partial [Paramuribaculum sp.]|nr:hypothetical protein [Paramuribaculum sp.]
YGIGRLSYICFSVREEGERVTTDMPEPDPLPDEADAEVATYRERWRRAIIDSEILQRKF